MSGPRLKEAKGAWKESQSIGEGYGKNNHEGKNMKTSIETKVGIAVASGFVALTMCVMAQGRSGGGTGGPNGYGPTNNPGVNSHMSSQGLQSSEFGRTTAEANRTKFSDDTDQTIVTKKGKKKKTLKSAKHKTEHARVNQPVGD